MTMQAVDRVIAILDTLAGCDSSLGVNEIARRAELSRGTVHRILNALQMHRVVEQDDETRQYRLGFRLMELGSRVVRQLDYAHVAQPHLKALAEGSQETAHLAVLIDSKAYYVAKVEGLRALRMPSQVGSTNPVHCTAVGKVLIAHLSSSALGTLIDKLALPRFTPKTIVDRNELRRHLSEVLDKGYGLDDEELELGLRCIAAPILDHTGRVVAAVSISGPTTRVAVPGTSGERDFLEFVTDAARKISLALGAPANIHDVLPRSAPRMSRWNDDGRTGQRIRKAPS